MPPKLIPRPLVERELPMLLLTAQQADVAMGATAMALTGVGAAMSDNSATMAPPECLALDGAAEAKVYAGSGFQAERDQSFNDGEKFTHYLKQAVVLFPLVDEAAAFLAAAAQQWPRCHQYIHTQSDTHWRVGQVRVTETAVSATTTEDDAAAPGWGCGRALVLKNNVIVDINTCSPAPGDSALQIANQIAANVASRW